MPSEPESPSNSACRGGAMVDNLGPHQLSCPHDPSRLPRHAPVHDQGDGRRPDGVTLPLQWRPIPVVGHDVHQHLQHPAGHNCAVKPGAAAQAGEQCKQLCDTALSTCAPASSCWRFTRSSPPTLKHWTSTLHIHTHTHIQRLFFQP